MRKYRIFKTDLWYWICRKKIIGKLRFVEYLDGYGAWTDIKDRARTFYTQDSAEDALVIVQRKWNKVDTTSNQTTSSWDTKEKQSWSEL